MNNENQVPRRHKRYGENFKRSAVYLWLAGGKSLQQIATELGVSDQSLKKWKQKLASLPATGPGQRSAQQLEEEVRRLRREQSSTCRHDSYKMGDSHRVRENFFKKIGIFHCPHRVLDVKNFKLQEKTL